MDALGWLQELGKSTGEGPGFHANPLYVACCIVLPVSWGLLVGGLLRLVESIVGVELGGGRAH
jgi:hypothetical protein